MAGHVVYWSYISPRKYFQPVQGDAPTHEWEESCRGGSRREQRPETREQLFCQFDRKGVGWKRGRSIARTQEILFYWIHRQIVFLAQGAQGSEQALEMMTTVVRHCFACLEDRPGSTSTGTAGEYLENQRMLCVVLAFFTFFSKIEA